VENDRCATQYSAAVHHKVLYSTGPGEWSKVSVMLKAGFNILSWKVYSLPLDAVSITTSAAIKIRLIEIRGQQ